MLIPDEAREGNYNAHLKKEIERANAMLRHFRGVAVSVLNDAQTTLGEICEVCADPRTCEQILEGVEAPEANLPRCGWAEFREKLHLLSHYLDYARRLLEASVSDDPNRKGGV